MNGKKNIALTRWHDCRRGLHAENSACISIRRERKPRFFLLVTVYLGGDLRKFYLGRILLCCTFFRQHHSTEILSWKVKSEKYEEDVSEHSILFHYFLQLIILSVIPSRRTSFLKKPEKIIRRKNFQYIRRFNNTSSNSLIWDSLTACSAKIAQSRPRTSSCRGQRPATTTRSFSQAPPPIKSPSPDPLDKSGWCITLSVHNFWSSKLPTCTIRPLFEGDRTRIEVPEITDNTLYEYGRETQLFGDYPDLSGFGRCHEVKTSLSSAEKDGDCGVLFVIDNVFQRLIALFLGNLALLNQKILPIK